jgi:hypothetical protein
VTSLQEKTRVIFQVVLLTENQSTIQVIIPHYTLLQTIRILIIRLHLRVIMLMSTQAKQVMDNLINLKKIITIYIILLSRIKAILMNLILVKKDIIQQVKRYSKKIQRLGKSCSKELD